jgi:hypothetical protein
VESLAQAGENPSPVFSGFEFLPGCRLQAIVTTVPHPELLVKLLPLVLNSQDPLELGFALKPLSAL